MAAAAGSKRGLSTVRTSRQASSMTGRAGPGPTSTSGESASPPARPETTASRQPPTARDRAADLKAPPEAAHMRLRAGGVT